jgi:predicted phage tail protein
MDAVPGSPVLRSASARRQGGSGTEPRYTCNVYIQERNDAYTVLRDFAAIFRGMTYWGGDQIVALADMPRDVDYIYTRKRY